MFQTDDSAGGSAPTAPVMPSGDASVPPMPSGDASVPPMGAPAEEAPVETPVAEVPGGTEAPVLPGADAPVLPATEGGENPGGGAPPTA